MSDSDEAANAQSLAYEEAGRLHAIKPDHPLLKYALWPDDDVVWEEFIARFGKPGISRDVQRSAPAVAYLYAQYWVALRQARAEIDGPIPVAPSRTTVTMTVPSSHGADANVNDVLPLSRRTTCM